jgi:Protein of unknown function (DUF4058)
MKYRPMTRIRSESIMAAIFPGIDPYIEAQHYWPDFHSRTITYCSDFIADALPDRYLVRIEERIQLLERPPESARLIRPDLMIEQTRDFSTGAGVAVELEVEPITVPLPIFEAVREPYIEILQRSDRTLVTVIELLSPDNKSGVGFGQYLVKRNALLKRPVHLVELDFLVGGRRLPMQRPLPPGDAYVLVARGDRRPDCEVYAWSIRRPLTSIRLPLMAPDPDLRLDLAAIYATAFEKGRYARAINYSEPLSVPLAPEDRAWAEERARSTR